MTAKGFYRARKELFMPESLVKLNFGTRKSHRKFCFSREHVLLFGVE